MQLSTRLRPRSEDLARRGEGQGGREELLNSLSFQKPLVEEYALDQRMIEVLV